MQKLTFVRAARVLPRGGAPGLSVRIDISILLAPLSLTHARRPQNQFPSNMKAVISAKRFVLLTWGVMAIAALLLSGMVFAALLEHGHPPLKFLVYGWVACLLGPAAWPIGVDPDSGWTFAAVAFACYSLSIRWVFRKPSGWSKTVFIILSVLWLLLGAVALSVAV